MKKDCYRQMKAYASQVNDDESAEEEVITFNIATVLASGIDGKFDVLCVRGDVGERNLECGLDTGATGSIMTTKAVEKYGYEVLASKAKIKSQNNFFVYVIETTLGIHFKADT